MTVFLVTADSPKDKLPEAAKTASILQLVRDICNTFSNSSSCFPTLPLFGLAGAFVRGASARLSNSSSSSVEHQPPALPPRSLNSGASDGLSPDAAPHSSSGSGDAPQVSAQNHRAHGKCSCSGMLPPSASCDSFLLQSSLDFFENSQFG